MSSMSSTTYYPVTPNLARWIVVGFLAGAASVLVFHQGAVMLMNALELTQRTPYQMQATQPFGVPQIWSITFWGGAWGVLFAAVLRHLDGARLVIASTLLGAVLPTLIAWFVVAPLKGQPAAAGFVPAGMAFGVIVNAAWGLGTGIGLALFGGRHRTAERRLSSIDRRSTPERRGAF